MSAELVEVRLVAIPLDLYRRSAEHHDELRRELALIERQGVDAGGIPDRLHRLAADLATRFGSFTSEPTGVLHQALARGDDTLDLEYRVPAAVKEACLELAALLDQADAYCRGGEHLLTLATPPSALRFRRWFLGEFVAQVDGADPTTFDDYAARASSSDETGQA